MSWPRCPNCEAFGSLLSYRLNDTVECQACGYRSDPEAFAPGHLRPGEQEYIQWFLMAEPCPNPLKHNRHEWEYGRCDGIPGTNWESFSNGWMVIPDD